MSAPAGKSVGVQVKERLARKGQDGFARLRKLMLGAVNTLSEAQLLEEMSQLRSLIDAGYLNLDQPLKENGSTMLHTCAWHRKPALVQFLLEHGASANCTNAKGFTPLHFACENADQEHAEDVIRVLIQHGASATMESLTDRQTPMDKATSHGARDLMLRLLAEADPAAAAAASSSSSGKTAQQPAAAEASQQQQQQSQLPGQGLGQAASRHKPDDPRMQQRAQTVRDELVRLFGQDSEQLSEPKTIMHLLDDARDLVDQGYLSLEVPIGTSNDTFLHRAVWSQQPQMVDWLLRRGASPNAPNLKGNTPLHLAAQKAEGAIGREIINRLLESGADRTLKNYTQFRTAAEGTPNASVRQQIESWKPSSGSGAGGEGGVAGGAGPSDESGEAGALLDMAEKAQAQMSNAFADSSRLQESDLQQRLARGKASKAARLINSAFTSAERAEALLNDQKRSQEADWQTKLARGRGPRSQRPSVVSTTAPPSEGASPGRPQQNEQAAGEAAAEGHGQNPSFRGAAADLERMHNEAAAAELAHQRAQHAQDDELAAKLRRGRRGGHKRNETMDVTQQLLSELANQEAALNDRTVQERAAADSDLARRIAAGRRKRGNRAAAAASDEASPEAGAAIDGAAGEDNYGQQGDWDGPGEDMAGEPERDLEAERLYRLRLDALFDAVDTVRRGWIDARQVLALYRHLQSRSPGMSVVKAAIQSTGQSVSGQVTLKALLPTLEALHVMCLREERLRWDFACLDAGGFGTLRAGPGSEGELVWECSLNGRQAPFREWATERARRHALRLQKRGLAGRGGQAPAREAGGEDNDDEGAPSFEDVTYEELRDALVFS